MSKTDIKAKLAQTLKSKEENISIFGLKTKFGGGRSTGFALIYDSLDARKKFDSKKMLRRVSALASWLSALILHGRRLLRREALIDAKIFTLLAMTTSNYVLSLLYRTATSSEPSPVASRERKSRAESRRSEVLLRLRPPPPVARRSERVEIAWQPRGCRFPGGLS